MNNNIGLNIKKLRLDNNLSQKEFGKIFHVTNSTVSYWEKGEREINHDTLREIASYFNVSLDSLYGNDSLINNDYQAIYKEVKLYDFKPEISKVSLSFRLAYIFLPVILNLIFARGNIVIFILFVLASFAFLIYDLYHLFITPSKNVKSYNLRMNKDFQYVSSLDNKNSKAINLYGLITIIILLIVSWFTYPFVYYVFFETTGDANILNEVGYIIIFMTLVHLALIFVEIKNKEYKGDLNFKSKNLRFNYFFNKLAFISTYVIYIYVFMNISFYGRNYFAHELLFVLLIYLPMLLFFSYSRFRAKMSYYASLDIEVI